MYYMITPYTSVYHQEMDIIMHSKLYIYHAIIKSKHYIPEI